MRDELVLAGWKFDFDANTPQRLRTIAAIENIFKSKENELVLSPGFADRYKKVILLLDNHNQPFTRINLNEPLDFLPQHFQILLKKLKANGAQLISQQDLKNSEYSDLSVFQKVLKKDISIVKKYTLKRLEQNQKYNCKKFKSNSYLSSSCLRIKPS